MSAGKSFTLVVASSASICCDNDGRQTDANLSNGNLKKQSGISNATSAGLGSTPFNQLQFKFLSVQFNQFQLNKKISINFFQFQFNSNSKLIL